LIISLVLIVVGVVWIGQGTGVLQGGSFMVGDPLWAVIGAATATAGVAIGAWALRGRSRA
jgi:hypothetical protein